MAIPSKIQSRLLDTACDLIASKMSSRVSWLDNSYGKIEVFREGAGRDEVVFPAIFDGGKTGRSMINLMPDRDLGNYMFIRASESHDTRISGNVIFIECDIDLIFWFNYKKVYPSDHQNRTIENIKYDVLMELKKGVPGVQIEWEELTVSVSESDIYGDYTLTDKDKGFLKRPYGAIMITTKIYYSELCD